ncbi:ubiquinol-cytochrome c reductase core subunit 1 [Savitreella phatthalungensis]
MFSRRVMTSGSRCLANTVSQLQAGSTRRSMATAAAVQQSFNFNVTDSNGIKVATRDDGRPTTSVSVVVRAGSRYETSPGVANLLEKFAFQTTEKRTSLRINREAELIGAKLSSKLTREHIILNAQCLREDLPYFVELLGEVITKTKYSHYVLPETVVPLAKLEFDNFLSSPTAIARDLVHNAAFRRGLGNTLLSAPETPVTADMVAEFARKSYVRNNIAVIATGADSSEISQLVGQYFADVPAGSKLESTATKYFGGEARYPFRSTTAHYNIAFPGVKASPHPSPEQTVLGYILGGSSSIKWSPGQSLLAKLAYESGPFTKSVATHTSYNDAGLFSIELSGPTSTIAQAAASSLSTLKKLASGASKEDVTRAVAHAKFDAYTAAEERTLSAEPIGRALILDGKAPDVATFVSAIEKVSPEQVAKVAKAMLDAKPSVAAVGETHLLPYYDEL